MISIRLLVGVVKIGNIMFFIIILKWLDAWYRGIMLPALTTPYFYMMLACWLLLVCSFSYLFFSLIDRFRMQYIQKKLMFELVKSALLGFLIATLLVSLYDLSLYFTAMSDFFRMQRASLSDMGALGMSSCFGGTQGQSWFVLQKILTILFLLCSFILSVYFVADIAYHLRDKKVWSRYVGGIVVVALLCYAIIWKFGFV